LGDRFGRVRFLCVELRSYNKTYGALGRVIIFLIWLWVSNIMVLLGAEFNAEMERGRAIQAGMRPEDKEPFVEPRDQP
jgi:membrane protein